jgi:HlyD family type I secretion membrane fusion protein
MTLDQRDTFPARRRLDLLPGGRTPHEDEVLGDSAHRQIWLGLGVAGLFLAVLFGWGLWARLDSAVYAPGQIEVANNRQAVQHRDGGIVSELDVHEGDRVTAGQVLLRLNADELHATERADADQVIELKALQARLLAELQNRPEVSFPAELTQTAGPDRVEADVAMALQRREFATRNAALATEKDVLSQKERESSEQITGYERQVVASQQQQRLITEEVDGLKTLYDRGLVPATRVRSLERNAAELRGGEGEYTANIARTREEIGESRIRVTDLERQRAADDSKDYQTAEFQLADLEPKLAAVRQQIDRTIVRAPATGRVVGLTIFTVGGVITPGQKLMDVVPENQPLVIEARVKPSDVSDLKVGQDTEIRISAFHDRGMPLLHGTVSKVSADSFTDDKTGQAYFRIEVTVPPSQMDLIRQVRGAEPGLKPGLPVEVVVPLHPRTALGYLTEPLKQMLWRSFREH